MSAFLGKYVLVRCHDAGVHVGKLENRSGRECHLSDSRRLWFWVSAENEHTLSGVARHGLTSESKIAGPVEIEVLDACEVIELTPEAKQSIYRQEVHNVK